MIHKKTVFILGAGISHSHGFPLGRSLIQEITTGIGSTPVGKLYGLLQRALGANNSPTIHDFSESLRDSGVTSIDSWLERNKNFINIGKASIAAVIAHYENLSLSKSGLIEGNWFHWIWNQIHTPIIDDLLKNNVTFITFNYDRLFEQQLYKFISNTYRNAPHKERDSIFKEFGKRIIHVHGALGDADPMASWNPNPDRAKDPFNFSQFSFTDLPNPGNSNESLDQGARAVLELSKGIKIIFEDNSQDNFKRARESIHFSDKIIFLGFGYEPRNIERLGLTSWLLSKRPQTHFNNFQYPSQFIHYPLVGSAKGLRGAEMEKAKSQLENWLFLDPKGLNAEDFSKEYLFLD